MIRFYAPKMSPDVFESSTRRQSKRTRSSTSTVPTSPSKVAEFTYVDPDFESIVSSKPFKLLEMCIYNFQFIRLFSYPEGDLDSVQVTSHELQRLEREFGWMTLSLILSSSKFDLIV